MVTRVVMLLLVIFAISSARGEEPGAYDPTVIVSIGGSGATDPTIVKTAAIIDKFISRFNKEKKPRVMITS